MERITSAAARLVRAIYTIYTRKWSFLAMFGVLFLSALLSLAHFDLLPEPLPEKSQVVSVVTNVQAASSLIEGAVRSNAKGALPVSLRIPSRNIEVAVANPVSTDIAVLDTELLKGAVRYPTSATLGQDGNVVIFGHSSALPVVHNSAFKAFNGLDKVKRGDEIFVASADHEYRYVVLSVIKESANSETAIPLAVEGRLLTLATCDSFGKQSDRFVVTAVLVE